VSHRRTRSKSIFVTEAGAAANVSRCGRTMPRPTQKLMTIGVVMESCFMAVPHPKVRGLPIGSMQLNYLVT
jgi:hypothetical protein